MRAVRAVHLTRLLSREPIPRKQEQDLAIALAERRERLITEVRERDQCS